jgi:hypothetical protein
MGKPILTSHFSYLEVAMATTDAVFSSMVRSGRTTYFVDVREAKTGKKYLSISENHLEDDDKRTRVTIRVYKETIDQFRQAIDEAAVAVNN